MCISSTDIVHTCRRTKIPPRNQAIALAPFLIKTPAQIPATAPNESSYSDTVDVGGGGIDEPWLVGLGGDGGARQGRFNYRISRGVVHALPSQ